MVHGMGMTADIDRMHARMVAMIQEASWNKFGELCFLTTDLTCKIYTVYIGPILRYHIGTVDTYQ